MKKVKLRLARLPDWPKIKEFHAEQNRRDGTNYALPALFVLDSKEPGFGGFAPGIARAYVGEIDGEIVTSFWFDCSTVECCFAGCDPRGTAAAWKDIGFIAYELKALGYTGINSKIPVAVVNSIEKPLKKAGFAVDDKDLKHFYRSLAEGE